MNQTKQILTTCTRDCPNTCGLIATVKNGRLTGLKGSPTHPLTKGVACHKTTKYIERVYSSERITTPQIKTPSGWQPVSWQEVLDKVAKKIKDTCNSDGSQAILYYQGYGERTALKLLNKYFFNLLGGVTTLHGSLCGGTGQTAQNLDFGHRVSHDPLDHYNSKGMILWARNPATTNISLMPIIKHIRKNGGRVIVIDPYKNRTVKFTDHHIAPEPGMDVYLALAAAKIILTKKQQHQQFLNDHCAGVDGYLKIVDNFSLTDLCKQAGVYVSDAELLADTLINSSPTSILLGWGLHRYRDPHYGIRAIDALAAISGNIGIAGGGVSQGFEEYGPYEPLYWGDHLNPPSRTLLMPEIGSEIMTASDPPIRMAVISAANPVCMAPESETVAKALNSLDMVVYIGNFMDDTAEQADIFLPATTFLEESDVMASYGHNYVGAVNQAIDPVGDCRSDFAIFSDLAQRFDFAAKFSLNAELWLTKICAPITSAGCSLEQLKEGPFRLPEPMVPYEDLRFPTPSGKFQLLSDFPPEQLPATDPQYPYTLLTIAAQDHICSERTLAEHPPLPDLYLNPEEISRSGLKAGEPALAESKSGSIKVLIKADIDLRKDCAVGERGGWIKAGHGFNQLTKAMTSTIGHGTPYYETRVRLKALTEK